jgi:capsular polysaccharide export protein
MPSTTARLYHLPIDDPTKAEAFLTETFAIGFPFWKHEFMRRYFPERHLHFVPLYPNEREAYRWHERLKTTPRSEILVWGASCPQPYASLAEANRIPVFFMEDGFLRSKRRNASRTAPLSLTLDRQRPYFDCRGPSDLEDLLMTTRFDDALVHRARQAIDLILAAGLTKYNGSGGITPQRATSEASQRILVVGQVEQDASIRYGLSQPMTNNDLVRLAAAENPKAEIIYRPHPDVLAQVRARGSDPAEVAHLCHVDVSPRPLPEVLASVGHVYTMTSLVGFEALLRGLPVTVVGAPFYSGWGLTDDRQQTGRRGRKLTLEELFLGAYVLYPLYFDPCCGTRWTIEQAMDWLQDVAANDQADLVSVQLARRPKWEPWGPYGILGWRHALSAFVAQFVGRIGNRDDSVYYQSDPIRFFRELASPHQRRIGRVLYPIDPQ